jgi:hypothetical protein
VHISLQACRECFAPVSTEATSCPKCGVPNPMGADWVRGACLGCAKHIAVPPTGGVCEHCGIMNPLTPLMGSKRRKRSSRRRRSSSRRRSTGPSVLGLVGNAVLATGALAPVISVPLVGAQNLVQNGGGDGTIILGLALIGFLLSVLGGARWMTLTGGASLLLVVANFVHFITIIDEVQRELDAELAGDPFRGVADVMMGRVQLQWGWALLLAGAVLVISAGVQAFRDRES